MGKTPPKIPDDEPDWEDRLNEVLASRGQQPNLSFFAFTATPKGKTLELFGRPGARGAPEAFHVYSMRQAIEEGFILDVLRHYTTYRTYYRLLKNAADDPDLPRKKAARALAKFMSLHPHNLEQKTEVIVEHFRRCVKHRLDGRAKAMVVTASRLHAVRYKLSFERYLAERGYTDVRPLVAFSGTVRDPDTGVEYTEPGMNADVVTGRPIGEAALPARFDSSDYQVLLVANKYQAGFDQPLLCAMYGDKRLDGVQAVQAFSRLNRTAPGKNTPFVLDFVNDAEDVFRAFKPYYDRTEVEAASDPARLEALKHELDGAQVYFQSEVEAFARVFYKSRDRQSAADHARLEHHLQPAVDRFRATAEDDERERFRGRLAGFVRLYAYLSQILSYADPEQEKLYSFGRLLLPHLPLDRGETVARVGSEVALQYYRLDRVHAGAVRVAEGGVEYVSTPAEVGTGRAQDEKAPLSEIVELLNERFGTQFDEADRLFFQQIKEKACASELVVRTALANSLDRFALGVRGLIERTDDRALGRERPDRDPLRVGREFPGRGVSGSRAGDLRGGPVRAAVRGSFCQPRRYGRSGSVAGVRGVLSIRAGASESDRQREDACLPTARNEPGDPRRQPRPAVQTPPPSLCAARGGFVGVAQPRGRRVEGGKRVYWACATQDRGADALRRKPEPRRPRSRRCSAARSAPRYEAFHTVAPFDAIDPLGAFHAAEFPAPK